MIADYPEDLADRLAQLGGSATEFCVRPRVFLLALIVAPLLLLLGVALAYLSFVLFVLNLKLLVFGVVVAATGVMMAVRGYRCRGLKVLIFPEGVLQVQRRAPSAFFWDEIDAVWQKKTEGGLARMIRGALVLHLRHVNGEEFRFDDSLDRFQDLCDIIHRETLRHLLPRSLNSFQAGTPLEFGSVTIGRDGLCKGKEAIPWSEVAEVKIHDGQLVIGRKGKRWNWYKGATAEVPNLHVFRALLPSVAGIKVTAK